MDDSVMRERVGPARVGRLATVTAGGLPHVVPCCFALGGRSVYSAIDAKPKSTVHLQRIRNLEINAGASLLVDHYDDDWTALWWVRIDGTGRILDSGPEYEHALDLLTEKYPQYRQTRPPGPVVALDARRWTGWP